MLKAPHGEAAILPFGGTVSGEVFNGRVLPGGADVQTVDASGVRHMCARYMLEGEDFTGAKCRVYIENNGWFSGGSAGHWMISGSEKRLDTQSLKSNQMNWPATL